MNIQRLKRLTKSVFITTLMLGMTSCKGQIETNKVIEIFKGIEIGNDSYSFSEESVFELNGQKYSLRGRAFYTLDGNINNLIVYKPEGALEYDKDDILNDSDILGFYGFPINQNWTYKNNQLVNKKGEVIEVQKVNEKLLKLKETDRITFFKIN
tara:strand:+ start:3916 stop:4377 length:462 start_codon:yes stop_codon:yes gene_type:complete